MPKLFDIGSDLIRISEILDECGGEIDERADADFLAWAESVHQSEAEKLDRFYGLIASLESKQDLAKAESKKFADLAASCESQVKWLKNKLKYHMTATGREDKKLESAMGRKFWIQRNGGSVPVLLYPGVTPEAVPDEYTVVRREIDMKAVREALLEIKADIAAEREPTKKIEFAELGVVGSHLRIR